MNSLRQRSHVERQAHVLSNQLAKPSAFINPETDSAGDPATLVSDLKQLGHRLLRRDGPCMALQPIRHDPGREILRWRDVSLRLPASLLIAAACAGTRPAMGGVRLLDRTLAPTHPVALLHVHQGAVGAFELLWARLRLELLTTFPDDIITAKGAVPDGFATELDAGQRGDTRDNPLQRALAWFGVLRAGFVVRECLLCLGDDRPLREEDLPSGLDVLWRRAWCQFAGRQPAAPSKRHPGGSDRWSAFTRPVLCPPVPYQWRARLLMRDRESTQTRQAPQGRSGLAEDAEAELYFLATAFGRCSRDLRREADNTGWPTYTQLLVQYLRLKCMLFRHLVADVDKEGFGSFQTAYSRGRLYRNPHSHPTHEAINLETTITESPLDVRAVEVRCSPDIWLQQRHRLEYPIRPRKDLESGWVLHFLRKPHDQGPREPREQGKPDQKHAVTASEPVLYADTYRAAAADADAVAKTIEASPRVLRSLRGVDLASNETDEPLWINLPHLRRLRQCSIQAAGNSPHAGLEPLRITVHVGEVYAQRASGLRAVHEPIAWGLLHRGDRLGHALVLGLSSRSPLPSESTPPPPVTCWNRLLDLGWMRYCTLCFNIILAPKVLDEWRREAERLVGGIWPGPDPCAPFRPDLEDEVADLQQQNADLLDWLAAAWLGLGAPNLISALGFPTNSEPPPTSVPVLTPDCEATSLSIPTRVGLRWLHSYLYKRSTRSRADEQTTVKVDQDDRTLDKIRLHLLRRIARWQIVIEVNPTSNLIIAGLSHPVDQPMFQLRPVDAHTTECVPIVLSSDNPITLATTLADEYAYAWAGAVIGNGRPPTYAREWLDEVAANSMRARFTVPVRPTPAT